ncbi:MAG: DegT/DnrJ/EryC1/StrS family aminotransferase [Candidatus Woesearchaeota archaeon]|nr:MAG: DegT/DnrJ/EryC1/StrS family aminotransferase [Candidatus Woesearchaeota archaeon]
MLIPHQKLTVEPSDIFRGLFPQKSNLSNYIPKKTNFIGDASAGIQLALQDKEIKNVGLPSFTCVMVLKAIEAANKTPVFIDAGVILEEIEKRNFDTLVLPYNFGFIPDLDKIVKFCKKNNITLVEDCAQALGAEYKDKLVGSFGKYCVYSFGISKNIGFTGGLINKEVNLTQLPKSKLFNLIIKGLVGKYFFNPYLYSKGLMEKEITKGYKIDYSSIPNYVKNVVFSISQRYDKILKTRRENAKICVEELDGVIDFVRPLKNTKPTWLYFILMDKNREIIKKKLLKESVDMQPLLTFKDLSNHGKKAKKAEQEHLAFALYRPKWEIDYMIKKIKKVAK